MSCHHRARRLCALLSIVPARLVAARAAPGPEDIDGWHLLARFLFNEAHASFEGEAGGRERTLGIAAALLNEQPRTPGRLARAEALLRELSAGPVDDASLTARYLLARIEQVHRPSPDPAAAATILEELATEHAGHPVAQLAATKLALAYCYELPGLGTSERLAKAAGLEAAIACGPWPELRASFYRILGGAGLFYGRIDRQTLEWLLAADATGAMEELSALSLRIQIAEVARRIGDNALAARYYRAYLATAGADHRRTTVEYFLAQLGGAAP